MLSFLWHRLLWPNYLRPLLRDHGLQLSSADYTELAAILEGLRGDQPLNADVIRAAWNSVVVPVILNRLDQI
jgi:hypothetical protein